MLNEWIHQICLLFLKNKIKTYAEFYLVSLGINVYVKIFFSITWIIQGVLACKILVAAVDVIRLHMLIAKVSVCEQISGPLNIRIYHKCWMVWKRQNYFFCNSICPVALQLIGSLYSEVLFFWYMETIRRG